MKEQLTDAALVPKMKESTGNDETEEGMQEFLKSADKIAAEMYRNGERPIIPSMDEIKSIIRP